MEALRMRRRRDGSLCITDKNGSTTSPDRDKDLPLEHHITFEMLARESEIVSMKGDLITLEYANAKLVYRIVERHANGVDVQLESCELVDAPPIDEAKAEEIASAFAAANAAGVGVDRSVANAGSAVVTDNDGNVVDAEV